MYKDLPVDTKKTLVAKLSFDITGSDMLIEMVKAMLRQMFIEGGFKEEQISFEVLVENQEDTLASMLNAVRSEFTDLSGNLAEIEDSEKSDGFADFLKLVVADMLDEDEDAEEAEEAEDDDEDASRDEGDWDDDE